MECGGWPPLLRVKKSRGVSPGEASLARLPRR